MKAQLLTVSSNGQISLPAGICKCLSIETEDKTAKEFEASLDEAQIWAKSVGYEENDVDDIIKFMRQKRRK